MRLFFSGSMRGLQPGTEDQFKLAATELGRESARRGHLPLLHSGKNNTIDYYIVEGLCEIAKERNIQVPVEIHRGIREKEIYVDRDELRIDPVPYAWADKTVSKHLGARAGGIVQSDAIVMLGGSSGTRLVGNLAADLRRPVVAVGCFGGSAEELYQANETLYLQNSEVSLHARALINEWHNGSASAILDICEAMGDEHSYFLSYAHKRPDSADYVETLLRRENVVVYRDETQLAPGDPLWKNIREHIRSADTFIGLWSKEAAESEGNWCTDEIREAVVGLREGPRPRRVILIQLDGTPLPDELGKFLHLPGHSRSTLARSVEKLLKTEHGQRSTYSRSRVERG